MLFNNVRLALNKAMEWYFPQSINKGYTDDANYLLNEKSVIYSQETARLGPQNKVAKAKRSDSSLLSLSRKRSWNSSTPSVNSLSSISVITSPSPKATSAPLWKEQVDPNVKAELSQDEIHRQEIIFEIIHTEKDFTKDVNYLIEHFISELQDSGIRLPYSLKQTFDVLPHILRLHRHVSLQLLCIQAIYPVIPSITHILRDLAKQFSIYESYLIHHRAAIAEIAHARKKNNKLGQIIRSLEAKVHLGKYLSIESLLTKPFQRLCKYPLLVVTLLKATSPDHEDRDPLNDLYDQIDCALKELQECKYEHERKNRDVDEFLPKKFGALEKITAIKNLKVIFHTPLNSACGIVDLRMYAWEQL
ncbi:2357_t:CDS:2 [Acaulospora morrowiae]|uniref:2357_t:CDS:1 n=1 Tax=Acaulospora morrowiae TaxID=94023 RepID=A0A9N9ADR6_9GLOM|nr:2357_t:CDS:2 [Acaulospora morrowiae]